MSNLWILIGYCKWLAEVPQDWVRQASPWCVLEIEDFECYRDLGDLHLSSCWTNKPPVTTYKGELSIFPTRTAYRALDSKSNSPHGECGFDLTTNNNLEVD